MIVKRQESVSIVEVGPGTYPIPPIGYGGGERVAFFLARELMKLGYGGFVLDYIDGWKSVRERIGDMTIIRVPFPFRIRREMNRAVMLVNTFLFSICLSLFLIRRSRKSRDLPPIDVLHVHAPVQAIIVGLLRPFLFRDSTPKLVYTIHSPRWMIPEEFSLLERIMARIIEFPAMKVADLVTFESPVIREKVRSFYDIPEERTMVLYNGVSTEEFDPSAFEDTQDIFTVVWAARICDQKNHLAIVEALPRIVSRHSEARMLFIGGIDNEEYFNMLKKRISELGMEKNVVFRGPISYQELKRIYAQTAIHLVFSRYTGFDVAFGENLASGRAIVVSDIPTIEELVTDGEHCLLVPPNDSQGLADAINELMENETLRMKLSLNARRLAEEKLDWSKLAMSLVERALG